VVKADAEFAPADKLSNATQVAIRVDVAAGEPASATIYQLDGIVRRAPSLQLTADAKASMASAAQVAPAAAPVLQGVPA
jgi:NADH-quinone oxidoreductase subunit G